ncbi:MAG: hypothetical protein QOI55_3068, partial [Actinomycetota bacterium]|nr:hypothetical protein [Actinomycetota bacterium]
MGQPDVTDAPADPSNSASESQSDSQNENNEERQAKPPTRVLLVRHAVTAQTGPLLSGRTPGIDLSERGVEQADAAAKRLAVLPIAAVYASPIERTTQTAQKIAAHHGLTVEPLPGVVEADYGDWTGQKLVDLAKTPEWSIVQVTPSRAQFPNGETIMAMQARTVAAVEQIVREHAHQT